MILDIYVFSKINELVGKYVFLDILGIFFSKYLPYLLIIWAVIFVVNKIMKKWDWKPFFLIGSSVLLSRFILVEIVRMIYYRPRPFILFPEIQTLINHSNSSSIPSGHMATFFALAVSVYFLNKKYGLILFLLSFLMGLSRIFVGVHYPVDILSGALIGILSGLIILKILNRFLKEKKILTKIERRELN